LQGEGMQDESEGIYPFSPAPSSPSLARSSLYVITYSSYRFLNKFYY
jgi:hypothetical protein